MKNQPSQQGLPSYNQNRAEKEKFRSEMKGILKGLENNVANILTFDESTPVEKVNISQPTADIENDEINFDEGLVIEATPEISDEKIRINLAMGEALKPLFDREVEPGGSIHYWVKKENRKAKCETVSNKLSKSMKEALKRVGAPDVKIALRYNPVEEETTKRVRGKKHLTDADFANTPIGTSIVMGNAKIFQPKEGTSNRISLMPRKYTKTITKSNGKKVRRYEGPDRQRHWMTLTRKEVDDNGNVVCFFRDNMASGKEVRIDKVNRYLQNPRYNRVMLTVHDPFKNIRQDLTLDNNGNIAYAPNLEDPSEDLRVASID